MTGVAVVMDVGYPCVSAQRPRCRGHGGIVVATASWAVIGAAAGIAVRHQVAAVAGVAHWILAVENLGSALIGEAVGSFRDRPAPVWPGYLDRPSLIPGLVVALWPAARSPRHQSPSSAATSRGHPSRRPAFACRVLPRRHDHCSAHLALRRGPGRRPACFRDVLTSRHRHRRGWSIFKTGRSELGVDPSSWEYEGQAGLTDQQVRRLLDVRRPLHDDGRAGHEGGGVRRRGTGGGLGDHRSTESARQQIADHALPAEVRPTRHLAVDRRPRRLCR